MKVLLLYDYPPSPSGLSTQGDLLFRGLMESGVETHAVHFQSSQEKEWYYRWFKPDIAVGIGYWGYAPQLVLHPKQFGILPLPWLVADGYIANHQQALNELPLILVTSQWVKEMYVRDGINAEIIEVLPVGCDTDVFYPRDQPEEKIKVLRESFGVRPDQLMILTAGGDATSKGAQEVMHALARIDNVVPGWKYVCKVWPQPRTQIQNIADLKLAEELGISDKICYSTGINSRNFMPYLLAACDIYAAPSRLEGFGMIQVEAGACEKPVIGIRAMGMLDTLIHRETALLANVATKIVLNEVVIPDESDLEHECKVIFDHPRTVDYRANIQDISRYLQELMADANLRITMGKTARKHVKTHFDYRIVAKHFVEIVNEKLGIY